MDATPNRLVLPVAEQDFAKFISGLLGRPQTIECRFNGRFDLGREDLISFHLVDQRVGQQNRASLIQFSLRIVYDDDSSVLLNSLADFESYREVRPLVSVAAHLSWTYLIKFHDKEVPEKQVIELSIRSSVVIAQEIDLTVVHRGARVYRNYPNFHLRIQHTARTWGTDIENLLTGQIRSWLKAETGVKALVNRYAFLIGLATFTAMVALLVWGFEAATRSSVEAYKAAAAGVMNSFLEAKVDFLVSSITHNPLVDRAEMQTGAIVASVILSLVAAIVVGSLAGSSPPSYLVLSEGAKRMREVSISASSWTWGYLIASGLASIIAGVSSRYIFAAFFASGGP